MNLAQRNAKLEEKLKDSDLPKAVTILVKDARKRKRNEKILAISLALDILLSVGLAIGYRQNHQLAVKAETTQNAVIRSCENSNDARKNNREIWDYIIELTAKAPPTPERDTFIKKINDTYQLRDCTKIIE